LCSLCVVCVACYVLRVTYLHQNKYTFVANISEKLLSRVSVFVVRTLDL